MTVKQGITLLCALAIGIVIGRMVLHPGVATEEKARQPKYWVAPMDPTYKRDKPGKSPMGMDLIPVYEEDATETEGIRITPQVEQNLGVRLTKVERGDLPRVVQSVGYVTADENRIEHIHTYTEGWVKHLYVKTTGEYVDKGQLLFALYSPKLISAQEEYLLAIKSGNDALIKAGQNKLHTLGVSKAQIAKIRKTMKSEELVKIFSTKSGIVSKLNIREGKYVKPETDLMTLEDLSQVWVIAEVYERQADWVRVGQQATLRLPYLPGQTWRGVVDYVYPQLDPQTHTMRVRLLFHNRHNVLKPNMYASVEILGAAKQSVLNIPYQSVVRTGRGAHVMLQQAKGQFVARPVETGIQSGERMEVLSGLSEGDAIVAQGVFLIDSESNLQAGFERLGGVSEEKPAEKKAMAMIMGMGVIKKIDADKHVLNIKHEPISALGWPGMTMDFNVAADVPFDDLTVGQTIHFMLEKDEKGHYLISEIHSMASMKNE